MRSEQEVSRAMEAYADMVLRLCMVYLKNYSDAEDAFQTVFLRYATSSVRFQDEGHEKAWFIRVTGNLCKDHLRSFFRSRTVPLEDLERQAAPPSGERQDLLEALHQLPRQYREVLYLHYYEGYTAPEIGTLLKKNPNTVYTQLRKAKALLKEALTDV